MKKIGKYCLGLLLLVSAQFAVGQDVVFHASVDKNHVVKCDVVTLRLILENAQGEITPPDLSDFEIVSGPTDISGPESENGMKLNSVIQYTLAPTSDGPLTIGSASVQVGDTVINTEPIVLNELKWISGLIIIEPCELDKYIYQSQTISKSDVYLYEPIDVTYSVHSPWVDAEIEKIVFPSLSGFLHTEVKYQQPSAKYQNSSDQSFFEGIDHQQVIYPERTGKLEIEPFIAILAVSGGYLSRDTTYTAVSKTREVNVKPLPENAPEVFSGAVGYFSMDVEKPKRNGEVNDTILMQVVISGKGNFDFVKNPTILFPVGLDVKMRIPPHLESVHTGSEKDKRTYQYVIIPQKPGKYEIPEFFFAYFDPDKEKYIVKSKGPIRLKVRDKAGESGETGYLQGVCDKTLNLMAYKD